MMGDALMTLLYGDNYSYFTPYKDDGMQKIFYFSPKTRKQKMK
jgi:hypothetical protein